MLRPLSRINPNIAPSQQKEEFITSLKHQIEYLLGHGISDSNEPEKSLSQLLQERKAVLPMREHSPLLNYTFSEIRVMQDCEFVRLISWIKDILGVLEKMVGNPTLKITLTQSDYDHELCPSITYKGRRIKNLKVEKVGAFNIEDDRYSYRQEFRGASIFIIPTNFLP